MLTEGSYSEFQNPTARKRIVRESKHPKFVILSASEYTDLHLALGKIPTSDDVDEQLSLIRGNLADEDPIEAIPADDVQVLQNIKKSEGAMLAIGSGKHLIAPRIAARAALIRYFGLNKAPKGVWLPHNYGVIVSRFSTSQGAEVIKKMKLKLKEEIHEGDEIVFDKTIRTLKD